MSWTQAQIVTRASRGDLSAFALLVERYRAPLISYVYGIVGVRDEAEELAQEAFCRAWQHLPRLKRPDKFASWLYQTAHNLAVSALRKPRLASLPDDVPAAKTSSPTEAGQHEELAQVHRAVGELPEPFRETVALRHFSGMSHEQIAEHLGIAAGTVRSRLSRGYAMLRERLRSLIEE